MNFEEVKRIRENPTTESCDIKELHKMIDIAIEKQIPKKLIINEKDGMRHCPNCDTFYLSGGKRHCEKCGQALDWSEEE